MNAGVLSFESGTGLLWTWNASGPCQGKVIHRSDIWTNKLKSEGAVEVESHWSFSVSPETVLAPVRCQELLSSAGQESEQGCIWRERQHPEPEHLDKQGASAHSAFCAQLFSL